MFFGLQTTFKCKWWWNCCARADVNSKCTAHTRKRRQQGWQLAAALQLQFASIDIIQSAAAAVAAAAAAER
jgi:hypothetical protein